MNAFPVAPAAHSLGNLLIVEYCSFYIVDLKTEACVSCIEVVVAYWAGAVVINQVSITLQRLRCICDAQKAFSYSMCVAGDGQHPQKHVRDGQDPSPLTCTPA